MKHDPFWTCAKELLSYKRQAAIAFSGLVVAASCFGAGLGLLLPVFYLLVQQHQSVAELIQKYIAPPGSADWRQHAAEFVTRWVPSQPFPAFAMVLGVIAVLALLGSTGRYIHEYTAITISARGAMAWRKRVFRRLIRAPLEVLTAQGSADQISRIMVDTRALNSGFQIVTGRAMLDLAKGLAALAVAVAINWQLALIAAIAAPALGVLLRKFGKRIRRASQQALGQYGRMLGAIRESVAGISVVKVHLAEGYERRRFNRINRELFDQEMRARRAKALSSPVVETLAMYAVMGVALVAAWRIFNQGVDPGEFMTVLAALGAAGGSLKPLASVFTQLKEADAAAARLLESLKMPVEAVGHSGGTALPRHHAGIRFEIVAYHYPGKADPAVDGVSLDIQFGQTVAIIGGNGAGKSTLLNMLPRLISPTSGRVRIDGVDVSEVSLRSLRRQIAVVTQQTILFQGTIADNIAYGRRHEPMDKIIAAARAAYADEFITQRPDGYLTLLGEDGSGLSGGQRQRLCIARAILRDPAILILDEATSQIDADSEAKINQALATFKTGRTTLVIAHRLSTVVDADAIVVMHMGRIVDVGRHGELLSRCSIYQNLVQTQLMPAM